MKRIDNKCTSLFFFFLIYPILLIAQSHYPGQHNDKFTLSDKAPLKAYCFDLSEVRLLDSPFKENMERDGKWLLSIPNERLWHSFRINAGMKTDKRGSDTKMPQALGGWEALDVELRGHSMGHVLSGLALMYASTGDMIYKTKGDSLVAALAEVQQVLNQDGYLSAFPRQYIDRCIAGTGVWAPWYTLHKINAGLLDMYLYADNKLALELVKNMATWAYKKLSNLTPEQLARMLRNEFGGMNEVFYNLYHITGNKEHLELANMFFHHQILDPLAQMQDNLRGLHANTLIPKIIGESVGYELNGNEDKKTIATFFWDDVIKNQTFITGGNSDREGFFVPGKISEHLSGYTGESCNTYNMLKLTRHLFCWYADPKYADYYEQALYNHILGQQDPETGMVCYFTPLIPGAFKLYSTPFQSFWCCVGTAFESHAKYSEGIYYHSDNGLYVNLFIPSELNWKENGIKIRQETKYPENGIIKLTIQSDNLVEFPILIRYPSWAISGAEVRINGKNIKIDQKPGSYITIKRKWGKDDIIDVTYPMTLTLSPVPDNPDEVAFKYGPSVLAAQMGTEGIVKPAPYSNPEKPYEYYTYDYKIPENLPHTLKLQTEKISDFIYPVNGSPLTFRFSDAVIPGDITLVPYFNLHHQRYVIYWDIVTK